MVESGTTVILSSGWGQSESAHVVGPDLKPLPERLQITFYSYIDDKIYRCWRWHSSPTSPQGAGPKRRLVAMPLPILGLSVGGVWVAGLSLYFLVHLGDVNVPFLAKEERQHTPVEGSHRTGVSLGQSRLSQSSAPAELSAPRFPVIAQVKEPAASVPSTEIAAGGPILAISLPGLSPTSPSAGEPTAPIATHSESSPSSSDPDLTKSKADPTLQSTPHRRGGDTTLAGQEESEPKTRQSRPRIASLPVTGVSAPAPAPDARQGEEASAATTIPHSQGLNEPRTFSIDASTFLARGDAHSAMGIASARLFTSVLLMRKHGRYQNGRDSILIPREGSIEREYAAIWPLRLHGTSARRSSGQVKLASSSWVSSENEAAGV
jgi:hypothetical protein